MADPYRIFQERITKTPGGFRVPDDPENKETFGRLEYTNPGLKVLREMFLGSRIPPEDRKTYDPVRLDWENYPDNYAGIDRDAPPGTISHEAGHGVIEQVVAMLTGNQKSKFNYPTEVMDLDEALTRSVADPLMQSKDINSLNWDLLGKFLSQGSPQQQELLTQLIRLRQQAQAASHQDLYNYIPVGKPSSKFPPVQKLK